MWNGKPIEKWTEEKKGEFWGLLTNYHYHKIKNLSIIEGGRIITSPKCNCGYEALTDGGLFAHIQVSNIYFTSPHIFFNVKDFMESKMAETWEEYLENTGCNIAERYGGNPLASKLFNAWLSLDNLITFLLENTGEWGWVECPQKCVNGAVANWDEVVICAVCVGTGKVKHPALTWAEELE